MQNYDELKMVNGKSILKQTKEFQKIVDIITFTKMSLNPILHINTLIFTLPPSWQDYKIKLIHEQDNMPLEISMSHLQVEE